MSVLREETHVKLLPLALLLTELVFPLLHFTLRLHLLLLRLLQVALQLVHHCAVRTSLFQVPAWHEHASTTLHDRWTYHKCGGTIIFYSREQEQTGFLDCIHWQPLRRSRSQSRQTQHKQHSRPNTQIPYRSRSLHKDCCSDFCARQMRSCRIIERLWFKWVTNLPVAVELQLVDMLAKRTHLFLHFLSLLLLALHAILEVVHLHNNNNNITTV